MVAPKNVDELIEKNKMYYIHGSNYRNSAMPLFKYNTNDSIIPDKCNKCVYKYMN